MNKEAKATLAFSIAFVLLWSWATVTPSMALRWQTWMTTLIALVSTWGAAYNLLVILGRRSVPPLRLETVDEVKESGRPLSVGASTLFLIVFAALWLSTTFNAGSDL
jgi:hypothetical protein